MFAPMPLYDTPEGRYQSSFKSSMETVKREIPLEAYAGTLTALEAFGRGWLTGRCPIPDHPDKSPSFFVYPDNAGGRAHCHCYGCNFHGDLFDLFRACEGGELWEAMMELSQRFDVELPKRPASWFAKRERQAPVRDLIGRARFDYLRRRLYRVYFRPLVAAVEDEQDRRHDEQVFWEATSLLARHVLSNTMGRRDG